MSYEPKFPEPREAEALLIAVDSFATHGPPSPFESLRDAAMRMARTRLVYSTLKDDLVAIVKSGSRETRNTLAEEQPGGYEGIEVVHPPVSKSLAAVKALADMTPGNRPSNFVDLLEVCGLTLSLPAVDRAKKKRLVLFTDGVEICKSVVGEYVGDFQHACEQYMVHKIQVDVICYCDDSDIEQLLELGEDGTEEERSMTEWMEKTAGHALSFLFVLSKVTGGVIMSFEDASPLVDRPTPKVKRATAKYRGTLNVADVLKIPVKRFSYVNEAKHPTGKKLSWEASVRRKVPIPVVVETQRVASAKDDAPLEAGEVVNAYPYGPELVPEQNEVDSYAWSIRLPKGLDVIGFVNQSSVPSKLFMGHVDVVIAMPGVDGADRLIKTLVLALHAEELGILARSVSGPKGGVPLLEFLWPRIELCEESGAVKNCYLFVVEIPMKEDVRDLPFGTLADTAMEVPENAKDAMKRYIAASSQEPGEEGDNEGDELLWPPDVCNPNLDWFNVCIVHRALAGLSDTDFPPLSQWHSELIDPVSFIGDKDSLVEVTQVLKALLPVLPVKKKEKKGRRVHQAVNGDLASILDYLPSSSGGNEDDDGDREDHDHDGVMGSSDYDDAVSAVTDFDTRDVGEESPVADFQLLVKAGKFNFAAVSMFVVIRRLIRDTIDDTKAMKCLQAVRRTSVERAEFRYFNDFVCSLVARCNRRDSLGNRTAAFFRHVGRLVEVDSTLKIIPLSVSLSEEDETAGDRAQREFLEDIGRQVAELAAEKKPEFSASDLTSLQRSPPS